MSVLVTYSESVGDGHIVYGTVPLVLHTRGRGKYLEEEKLEFKVL